MSRYTQRSGLGFPAVRCLYLLGFGVTALEEATRHRALEIGADNFIWACPFVRVPTYCSLKENQTRSPKAWSPKKIHTRVADSLCSRT